MIASTLFTVGLALSSAQATPPEGSKPLREHARVHGSYGLRGVSGDVAVTYFAPFRFDLGFVSRQTDSGVFVRFGFSIPLVSRDAATGLGVSSSLALLAGYRPPANFDNPWWHGAWPIALADFTYWVTPEFAGTVFAGGGALLRNLPGSGDTADQMDIAIDLRAGLGFAF